MLLSKADRRGPLIKKSSTQRNQPLPYIPPFDETEQAKEEEEKEEEEDEDLQEEEHGNLNALYTPGPGSSVSQTSSFKSFERERTSWVHKHAVRKLKRQIPHWECKYCTISYKYSGGSGALVRHLKDKHSITPGASSVARKRDNNGTAVVAAVYRQAQVAIEVKAEKEAIRREDALSAHVDETTLEYLYIRWVFSQDLAFHQVTHEPFRTFLEYVNPVANRQLPNASEIIRQHALKLFAEGKQRLRHIFASALSDIHITCDMWTSPNNLPILAIVSHFTSEKLQLQTATLALKEIEGEHSGLNQSISVLEALDNFQIRGKLGYFVMDNAASNNHLINAVANSLEADNIAYDPVQRRLGCNGHVINLVVQAFLFGKEVDDYEEEDHEHEAPSDAQMAEWRKIGPLGKLHNIVVWISRIPQRIQAFKKHSEGLITRRDNGTHWNSWYEMPERAMRLILRLLIRMSYMRISFRLPNGEH